MKKTMFWFGLVALVLLLFACVIHVFWVTEASCRGKIFTLWLAAFSSVGSFGAVIVALYLEPIKKYFLKPELNLLVGNMAPFCMIDNVETTSSGKEEFIDICCKIQNDGATAAEKCRVVCEEILTLGADKKFAASEDNKFRPQFFSWLGAGERRIEADIGKSFYEYVKLAEIRTRSSELGKAPDGAMSKKGAIPYMVVCLPSRKVKNQYMQFDDESSIIVHLSIVGGGLTTQNKYIQIVWEGKAISDFRNHPEKLAVTDVTKDIRGLLR